MEANVLTGRDHADGPAPREYVSNTRANTARLLCAALRERAGDQAADDAARASACTLAMPLTVLWSRILKFDAADPGWPDRDRCVAASAPAIPLLRALLSLSDAPAADAAGHATRHPDLAAAAPGGQGVAIGAGMALAERVLAARYGKSLVDHRTWVVAEAGDLARGAAQEAASLAALYRLDRLALIVDASQTEAEDPRPRFASLGWATKSIDAEDAEAIEAAFSFAMRSRKPTLLWCIPSIVAESAACRSTPNALEAWRRVGARGTAARRAWLKRIARHAQRPEFDRAQGGRLPESFHDTLTSLKHQTRALRVPAAPGEIARLLVDRLAQTVPELFCGLVEGVLPRGSGQIQPGQYQGRFAGFGRRAHGMAACLNGIALHGGTLPVAVTTPPDLIEQLPALRLAAAFARRQLLVVLDPHHAAHIAPSAGPLASELATWLRAIPGLELFQPGSGAEAFDCLELALRRTDGPSVLIVAGVAAPRQRADAAPNGCARGGYVYAEAEGKRDATLLASGRGLRLALEAREKLRAAAIEAAVVSLPCWAAFARQEEAYRETVLGAAPRFAIDAAMRCGWDQWLNAQGDFVGLPHPPAPDGARADAGHDFDAAFVAHAVHRRLRAVAPPFSSLLPPLLSPSGQS